MDTTAATSKLAESNRYDQFIPVRKEDLFSALIKQGDLADPVERELFLAFCAYAAHDLSLRIFRDARSAAR